MTSLCRANSILGGEGRTVDYVLLRRNEVASAHRWELRGRRQKRGFEMENLRRKATCDWSPECQEACTLRCSRRLQGRRVDAEDETVARFSQEKETSSTLFQGTNVTSKRRCHENIRRERKGGEICPVSCYQLTRY